MGVSSNKSEIGRWRVVREKKERKGSHQSSGGEKRVKRIINQNRVSTCIIEYTERSRNQNRNVLPTAWKRPLKSFKKKKGNFFQTESSNILKMIKIKTEHLHHCQWFPSITCEAFFGFGLQRREGRIKSRVDLNKLKAVLLYTRYRGHFGVGKQAGVSICSNKAVLMSY